MKASEVTECHVCGVHPLKSGVGKTPAITFFRVRAERFMLNRRAAEQTVGMHTYFGGGHPALAELFNPNPNVYQTAPELTETLIVCDNCAAEHSVFSMLELASERKSAAEEAAVK